jgi:hypothetical protein
MSPVHDADLERGGEMSEQPLWRLVAGQKMGPYAPEKLRPLMKDGRISPLDRFSYDGVTWRPPTEFPELLRAPVAAPAAVPIAAPVAVDPLNADGGDSHAWHENGFLPTPTSGFTSTEPALDDAATKKLLAMIHGLIWVGVGVVVILVTLMIVTTVFYKPAVSPTQPPASEASQPGKPVESPVAAPAAEAKEEAKEEEPSSEDVNEQEAESAPAKFAPKDDAVPTGDSDKPSADISPDLQPAAPPAARPATLP